MELGEQKVGGVAEINNFLGGVAEINNQEDQHNMTYIFLGEEGRRKGRGYRQEINIIYHHIVEWTRKSHDLRSTKRLAESWMLQIIDMRMGFPCPFHNVAIDYFSLSRLLIFYGLPDFNFSFHQKPITMTLLPMATSCYWKRLDVII